MNPKEETIKLYANLVRELGSGMGYEDFLLEMMKKELSARQENQQNRRIRAAGFPYSKTLDEFDFKRLEHVQGPFI